MLILLYRLTRRTILNSGEQKRVTVFLEVYHWIHTNIVKLNNIVLVEGMMREVSDIITVVEEVLGMIKEVKGIVFSTEVLATLRW